MLLLYLLLLGLLAMLTAYTRNVQSTLITLGQQIAAPGALPTPRRQALRTMVLVLAWPAAMGFGMLFIAWWKAAALMVAAFLLLVPAIGSFLPRPMSVYYLDQIRSDLEQRVARGGPDAAQLRRILAQSDALSRRGPHQRPS
jgi:hypothetical protein